MSIRLILLVVDIFTSKILSSVVQYLNVSEHFKVIINLTVSSEARFV